MPTALGAGLHDVGAQIASRGRQLTKFPGRRDASPLSGQPVAEHISHQPQPRLLTDRAVGLGLRADIAGRADQLRVRITHLIASESAETHLVDQHSAGQSMVDDASTIR